MKIIRTRKERLQEKAKHPGKDHYRIFYKDNSGKRVQVSDFWATDSEDALETLEIYKLKQRLIDPNDKREYFYGMKGVFITDAGNGMEAEYDDFCENMADERESLLDNVTLWFKCVQWRLRDAWYVIKDFLFFFKHYDARSNKSHNRNESWNLDDHILDDIEFNIPIIKENKDGVPNKFCEMAHAEIHKGSPLNPNANPSEEEMTLGEKMWNAELDNLLLHVRLYRYYSSSGIIDNNDKEYLKIEERFKDTLPYQSGTDKELDYVKLNDMTQSEWKKIWEWMTEYGQMLWA